MKQARTSDISLFLNDRSLMSAFFPARNVNETDWCKIFPGTPQHLKDIAEAKGTEGGYEQRVRDLLKKQPYSTAP